MVKETKKKLYLSGRITGDTEYKKKFAFAREFYEDQGYIVLDPSVLPCGMSNADYARICFAMMDSADEAAFLPGYASSSGAMTEHEYCQYVKRPTRYARDDYRAAAMDLLKNAEIVSPEMKGCEAYRSQLKLDAARLMYYLGVATYDIATECQIDRMVLVRHINEDKWLADSENEVEKTGDCTCEYDCMFKKDGHGEPEECQLHIAYDKLDSRLKAFIDSTNAKIRKMVDDCDKEAKVIRRLLEGKAPYSYCCVQKKVTGIMAKGCDSLRVENGVAYCSDHVTSCCFCEEVCM